MKKLKKLMTLLLAVAMTLTMSSAVFAATPNTDLTTPATITVTNIPQDAEDFSGKAYEIFALDSSESSGVKFADPFTSLTFKDGTLYQADGTTEVTAADLQAMLTDSTTASITGTLSGTTATFSRAEAGAYLVILADTNNTYNPMIAVTYDTDGTYAVSTDTSLSAKASGNSLTKEDEDEDKTVSVGDVLTYTITTSVPYFPADATDKTFTVTDSLKGADYAFTETDGWVVTLGGDDVTDNYPAPTATGSAGSRTFTAVLSGMISDANAGKKVTITYKAKVTAEDLAANGGAVNNVAQSSNADNDYTTNPEDDKSGSVTIVKTDSDGTTALKGAQFILLNEDGTQVAKVTYDETNGYYFAGWETYSSTTDYVDSTDYAILASETEDKNSATVKGLAAGTYQFKEIKAPEGYSINSTNVTETITASVDETSGEVTVTSDSDTMKDTKISELPSTGGHGTMIFTVIGCAVMIFFAVSYMRSKKKSAQ